MLCQKRWSHPGQVNLSVKVTAKRTKPSAECALTIFSMEIELPEEPNEDPSPCLEEHFEFLEILNSKTVARLLKEHQLFVASCRLYPRAQSICLR
jgi:hypothetical protein